MKGIASGTLLLVGHVTLALTSSYVLTLLNQRGLLNLGCSAVVTYGGFLLLGTIGVARYLKPSTLLQIIYRELSSICHAVGMISLALLSLQVHNLIRLPDTTVPIHFMILICFVISRLLLGARFDDVMTKIMWSFSTVIVFYTGVKTHHMMEMLGSTFLASSFFTFYFNRVLTDNRVIFGISDLVWYLLLLNISLLMIGHSFFSLHYKHFM